MRKRNLFYGLLILPMIFMASLSGSNGVSKHEDTVNKMTEIRKAVAGEQSATLDLKLLWESVEGGTFDDGSGKIDNTLLRFAKNEVKPFSSTVDFLTIADDGVDSKYQPYVRNYGGENVNYYLIFKNSGSGDGKADSIGCGVDIRAAEGYLITGIDLVLREYNLPPAGSIRLEQEGKVLVSGDTAESINWSYDLKEDERGNEITLGMKRIGESGTFQIHQLSIRYILVDAVTLNFDTGCAVEIEAQSLVKNEGKTVRPEDPTRPNEGNIKYTFDDWYVDKEFSAKFVFGNTLSEDTTVYAKWIEEEITGYTVSFNLMGGTGEILSQVVEEGKTAAEPLEIPTKATDSRYSYEFAAWCIDESYSALYDFSTPVESDIELYAYYDYTIARYEGEVIHGLKNDKFTGESVNTYFTGNEYNQNMTIESEVLNTNIATSTFTITSNYDDDGENGIRRAGDWDVRIRYADVTWEIEDYSKYIDTVRLEIKNTQYHHYGLGVVKLYKNAVMDENYVDETLRPNQDPMALPDNKPDSDTVVQMLGNTDETIRKVVFTEREGYAFGWENIRYILKDASVEQQCLNFANDFLNTIRCDGIGSVTSSKDAWNAIGEKVNKYFDENVLNALKEHPNTLGDKVAEALERYDLIVSKYGESEYVDFLNRVSSTSLNGFNPFSNNDNLTIIIITISVIMMVTTVMFYIRRRRVIK